MSRIRLLFITLFLLSELGQAKAIDTLHIDTLNMMIVVTPAAIDSMGGPQNTLVKIVTAVRNINQSFINSNIHGYVNIVHTDLVQLMETGCMYDMLNHVLTNTTPDVEKLNEDRTNFSADIVVVIVNMPDRDCGLSGDFNNPQQSFILVHYDCIMENYSIARQLGYLLGCGNNQKQSGRFNPDSASTAYGYFYEDETGDNQLGFTTIMGYTDELKSSQYGDFNMIPYWSNPDINYRGNPVGDEWHNNAKQINNFLPTVTTYRTEFANLSLQNTLFIPYTFSTISVDDNLYLQDLTVQAESLSSFIGSNIRVKRTRIEPGADVYIGCDKKRIKQTPPTPE